MAVPIKYIYMNLWLELDSTGLDSASARLNWPQLNWPQLDSTI